MFTGIIRNLGQVKNIGRSDSSHELQVVAEGFFDDSSIGDSVAVNGVCLTIKKHSSNEACFDLATETIRKTSLSNIQNGKEVNIEKSLRLGQSIDGHLVYGHVDQTAEILEIIAEDETWKYRFALPVSLIKYFAPKGSVSIDGVSLTIGEVEKIDDSRFYFTVYIIPHSFNNTIFKSYSAGEVVNIEIDPLARYAVHAISHFGNNQ